MIDLVQPNMVLLNEHGVSNNNKFTLDGYFTFSKNRQNRNMCGVSISTKKVEAEHVIKIKEGVDQDEFILVKNEKYKPAINVMTVYGDQKSRSSKPAIFDKWGRVLEVVYDVLTKGESLILMGDMNRHVGSDHLGVANNHDKVTYGDSLIRDMVETEDMILVNNTEKAEGGPFTRKDPSNPNDDSKKSCLDLCLISKDLYRYVDKLVIDKEEKYEMGRVVVKNGTKALIKPDHLALILSLIDIPINRNKVKKKMGVRYNTRNPDGWNNYKEMTEQCPAIIEVVNDATEDVGTIHRCFESIHNKIKFNSFGKTRISKSDKSDVCKDDLGHIEVNTVEKIMKQKSDRLEKEIYELKSCSNSRSTRAFKLVEKIRGPKKSGPDAVAIQDPFTVYKGY